MTNNINADRPLPATPVLLGAPSLTPPTGKHPTNGTIVNQITASPTPGRNFTLGHTTDRGPSNFDHKLGESKKRGKSHGASQARITVATGDRARASLRTAGKANAELPDRPVVLTRKAGSRRLDGNMETKSQIDGKQAAKEHDKRLISNDKDHSGEEILVESVLIESVVIERVVIETATLVTLSSPASDDGRK